MSPANETNLSDEMLVAYIDGELSASEKESVAGALSQDADARERLAVLEHGGRAFSDAFDVLLKAAPDDKLQAMFAEITRKNRAQRLAASGADSDLGENVVPLKSRPVSSRAPIWRMAAAAAILALVFAGGLTTGGFFDQPTQLATEEPGWREAAARYVAMFSQATLEGMPSDQQERHANLERIQTALGLPLPSDRIDNPELSFQGTQLLQLKGKPLAQISYLSGGDKPVALCIIRTSDPASAPAEEKRHGLNIVHWVAGGYGYMVIGDVPDEELGRIARTFHARFS